MSSREVRSIGDAGWGRTLGAGVISLIYFFPVLFIILTAFKTRADALAMPIKFVFTPTLEQLRLGLLPRRQSRAAGVEATRLRPLLLQLDLHRRHAACCWR